MLSYLDFFFKVCLYVFPILFALILIARITKPHSLKVLNYLKKLSEKSIFVVSVYIVSILATFMRTAYCMNPYNILIAIVVAVLSGAFIAFVVLAIIRLLPEYLDDENK